MAANTRVTCPAATWTKVVDNATGDVAIMLANDVAVYLQATTTDSAPSGTTGPLELLQIGDGWSEATIAEKFTNSASNTYLWVYPKGDLPNATRSAIIGVVHG